VEDDEDDEQLSKADEKEEVKREVFGSQGEDSASWRTG
jgi:hypothetical protein